MVPEALLEIGTLQETSHRLGEACQAYRRLLAVAPDDDRRAGRSGGWHACTKRAGLFLAARDSYLDLQARFPKVRLRDAGREATALDLAAAELARPQYAQLMRRSFSAADAAPTRAALALGCAPRPADPIAERQRRGSVNGRKSAFRGGKGRDAALIDPTTGLPRWSAEMGEPAVWAGYLCDKLIAATSRQIVALELSQGTVQWRFDVARSGKDMTGPDPFADAKPGDAHERHDRAGEVLSGFHVMNGRVFCLRGRRELIALDGDSGALDWSFSSPPGEINANLWVGHDRAVLQIDKPNELLVLRTEDGQPTRHVALAENDLLCAPPCRSMRIRSSWCSIGGRSRNSTSIPVSFSGRTRRALTFPSMGHRACSVTQSACSSCTMGGC